MDALDGVTIALGALERSVWVESTLTKGVRDEVSSRLVSSRLVSSRLVSSRLVLIAFAIAASQCSGDPGDPEVRLGIGELQFVRPPFTCDPALLRCPLNVLTDYDLTNPYYNWSINHEQLTSVALANGSDGHPDETYVDRIPLDEAPNIEMRYRSTAPFNEQDEVLVFSLDPEQAYATVWNELNRFVEAPFSAPDDLTWLGAGFTQAATLAYPPSPTSPLFSFTTVPLPTSAFLFPQGPGGLPDGSGSVKAARVVQHGRCSSEQLFTPVAHPNSTVALLNTFVSGLDTAVHSLFESQGGSPSRRLLAAVPFLHQTEDREDAQWGGFFIAGHYVVGVPVFDNIHLRAAAPFLFNLVDGIGSLTPLGAISQVIGHSAELTHFLIDEFLDAPFDPPPFVTAERINPASVAEAFYQAADDAQGVTSSSDKTQAAQCTLRIPPGELIRSRTIPVPAALDQCALFVATVDGAITTNAATVTPPLTANEQRTIRNVLEEQVTDPYDPTQTLKVFKNFRCNPTFPDGTPVDPNDPTKGVCEVVARAKRINTYPDAVELVFFDDEREVTAEAYGLFIFLGGDAGAAEGNALCSRLPVPGGTLHARRFDLVFLGAEPGP